MVIPTHSATIRAESDPASPGKNGQGLSHSAAAAALRDASRSDRVPFSGEAAYGTPQTHSPASSVSMQSMRDSSGENTPPKTPPNTESLAAQANNLSLQNDGVSSTAMKRCSSSAGEGRPSKHLHSDAKTYNVDDARQGVADVRSRAPRSTQRAKRQRNRRSHAAMQGSGSFQPNLEQSSSSKLVGGSQSPVVQSPTEDWQKVMSPPAAHSVRTSDTSKASQQAKPHFYQKTPKLGGHSTEPGQPPPRWKPLMQSSKNPEYAGMLLQPDSSPISEQQLAAEIQGIYDGVVTVELKCIDIDAALARDTKTPLGLEQWQALIALHRTLLYEHHDFLMATQHPSATESLRALAIKHSMPARMWKHGIHAFLEVLRHRRPGSQDYMLAFVVLAYQMMALLYETVPCFTDTWIECLGDLARYRMAIEEDREMHAVWGGVAARWYTLASDRSPQTGRLYHHLGILERPSMRKFAAYAKSLTCSLPFANARDSMSTFCTPIVQEEHLSKAKTGSAEALAVTFFALVFLGRQPNVIKSIANSSLQTLSTQPSAKTKDFGPHLALSCIAAVFEFGSSRNALWASFSTVLSKQQQQARPSQSALPESTSQPETPPVAATAASSQVMDFYFACFNTLTRQQNSTQSNSDALPAVHVILAWFYSLHSLGARNPDTTHTIAPLMEPSQFSWAGLCLFLNGFCQDAPIDESVFEAARQDGFPGARDPSKFIPVPEDYSILGLLWAQLYLPAGLLPPRTDEIESPKSGAVRTERVQWLALSLAFRTRYIKYDVHKKAFYAPLRGPPLPLAPAARVDSIASSSAPTDFAPSSRSTTWAAQSSAATSPTATSRSSTTVSTAEDSDGFTLVPRHKSKPKEKSWARVAAGTPRKARPRDVDVEIVDAVQEPR